MPGPDILLVEDEENLGKTLCEYLKMQGHDCFLASTAHKAFYFFKIHRPKIVLMDIGLPDGNGFSLIHSFQKLEQQCSFLFLSALNDPETRVKGLEMGALDYITKPFAVKELLLRLERLLFSQSVIFSEKFPKKEIKYGPLKIWFSRYEVQDGKGRILALGKKERNILKILYQNRGRPVTREELIRSVWGSQKFPSNRTVDNYIVPLRKWCETDPQRSLEIESVWGVGYKLKVRDVVL